jgi:transposase-like protein
MTQFMREYGIPESTFYFWVKKHSEFRQAYWYALTAIGDRREIGALKREYDAGTVDKTISHYCSVNAAAEERRAKLKREEQGSSLEDLTNCVQKLVEQKWGDDDKEQKD